MAQQTSLDAVGVRLGADRSSLVHGYLEHYEAMLAPHGATVRILDLSLVDVIGARTFAEHYEQGHVIVNIHPDYPVRPAELVDHPCLVLERRNFQDPAALAELATLGPFDMILENGRHVLEDQILAIDCLFGALSPGGHMVVEAAFASVTESAPLIAAEAKTIEVLRDIGTGLARGSWRCDLFRSEALRDGLAAVTFAKHSIALRRTPGSRPVRQGRDQGVAHGG